MTSTLLPPSFPPRPAPESVRVVDEPAAVPSPVQTAPERVSAPPKPPRDGFLDTVRSIALVRVVIWHAFGVPWISWVIATMPTMFFVAGSLLASTLDRKPIGVMYRSRLKRLLVPYWLFAGSVLSVLSIVHLAGPSSETALRPDQVLPWLVPFTDPTGPAWEAGWAASPLWYLRAYLWLLLLSPILRAAVRRFGAASLAPMLLATAAIELWLHNPTVLPIPLGTWTWMLGELTLYGFFLMLGFCHYDGAFERLGRAELREWGAIGVVACVLWWSAWPAPTGVVNHSFVALLAVGVGWLALFLLLRPVLSRATANSVTAPVVHVLTRRAMTVYLWHSPCIAASYWLLGAVAPDAHVTAVLVPTAVLVVVAILATGWIEDVASGRRAELWPRSEKPLFWRSPWHIEGSTTTTRWVGPSFGLATGTAAALVVAGLMVSPIGVTTARPASASGASDTDLPPAPSGRPGVADFATDPEDETTADLPPAPSGRPSVTDFGEVSSSDTAAAAPGEPNLDTTVAAWLDEFDVAGARVAVSTPDGTLLTSAQGTVDGEPTDPADVVPLTSATKSMTAAIVLDLVDDGLLGLDEPIPQLNAVPSFTHRVTLRQVLNHTAGITPYQEAQGFDAAATMSPVRAVELSAASPLQWEPGAERGYSNSGYLVLGLLIEQVTGRSFADHVAEQADRLGLETLELDTNPRQGWVGDAAGGLVGDVADLAGWGAALYRDGAVLSDAALDQMTTLDDTFGVGLGAFPACPCNTEDGVRTATSIGHNGGEVSVQYSAADGLVIAVSLTESLWTPFLGEQDVYRLLSDIRAVV